MKKIALVFVMAGLTSCAVARKDDGSTVKDVWGKEVALTINDVTAEAFMAVLSVAADIDGGQVFKTSDSSLETVCLQGLRASCTFKGVVRESSITIYDAAAEQFASVLAIAPDVNGDRLFKTRDGKLAVSCAQGLRNSCTIQLK